MSTSDLERVRTALRQKDLAGALDVAGAAVADVGARPAALASILGQLVTAGAAEHARRLADACIARFGEEPVLLLALGEALAASGDLDDAIALALRCQACPVLGGRADLALVRYLLRAGRVTEADAAIVRHMAAHPPSAEAGVLLSEVHERQGRFADAAEALVPVAAGLRTAHGPWLRAVRLFLRAGDPTRAAAVAEAAHRAIGPNHVLATEWCGALHACGRFEAAASVAQAGIALRPEVFALHRQAIISLMAAGATEAAGEACLLLLRSVEIHPAVTMTVANFLKSLPTPSDRVDFVERARATSPHPLIELLPGAGASPALAAPAVLDSQPFATECFPPDDVVAELAEAFAGTGLPFSAQVATWGERRRAGRLAPQPVTAFTVPNASLYVQDGIFAIANAAEEAIDLCARRPVATFLEEARAAPITARLGQVFLINGVGLNNYAHWSLDLLPQIALARTHFPDAQVMIPGMRPLRYIDQTISHFNLLGSAPTGIVPGKYRVESLTLLNASVFPTSRHALQLGNRPYARHLIDRVAPQVGQATRRLFIDRAPPQRRTAINRAALIECVTAFGFETIDPGTMTVAEQVATFASASHVAGLHGAAMANVMYCRPGARVLEIHCPDHSTTAFAVCAFVAGCTYRPHVGRSAASEGRLWASPQDMDFLLDPRDLERDFAWLVQ